LEPTVKLSFAEKIILAILEDHPKGTLNAQRLHSRIPRDAKLNKEQVYRTLLSLANKGLIDQPSKGNFSVKKSTRWVQGTVMASRKGELLVKLLDDSDEIAYLPSSGQQKLIPGDVLQVELIQGKRKNNIVKYTIEKRTESPIVGYLDVFKERCFLLPIKDGYPDIRLPDNACKPELDGQKAVVRIKSWPENAKYPLGRILEVLGESGKQDTEMHAIVAEFGFQTQFPTDVELFVDAIPSHLSDTDIQHRKDLRKDLCITIDPKDAKDFDDAISFKVLENATIELGVHIADVSHYVPEASVLDIEALNRGTSVYLADRTIPMLPEKLSNGLCSLNPNVDRLAFSVIFTLNADYTILDRWIGKTVIHSKRRFSYEEAQIGITDGSGDYGKELQQLNAIAQHFEKIRFQHGALRFESKEIRFELDAQGNPIKATVRERFEAHKLIETFMLMANEWVAEYVRNLSKPAIPFIYRTHDSPPPEKLNEFARFCGLMGYPINIDNEKNLRTSFNGLMDRVADDPSGEILQQLAIRTMAKAVYTAGKTSHFGLAFPYYTHFTSPIRRYPDLLAHRILYNVISSGTSETTENEIERFAKHCSNKEQQAVEAERASSKHMMARLMEKHKDEELQAVITGITEWGIFATVTSYHAEGLIRIMDIKGDRFLFVENEKKLIGQRTRKSYHLGDTITVKVKKTDPIKRIIDFYLLD